MATRNIQMNYYNGSSYDQLYPQTIYSNILDIPDNNIDLIWETGQYTGTGSGKSVTIIYSTENATPLFISITSFGSIDNVFRNQHQAYCYTGTIPLANYKTDPYYQAYYGTSISVTSLGEEIFYSFPVLFRVKLKANKSFDISQLEPINGVLSNIINANNMIYEYCLLLKSNI